MNWPVLTAEIVLGGLILLTLVASAWMGERRAQGLWKVTLAGLAALAAVLWWQRRWLGQAFDPMFAFDGFAAYFKWLFLLTLAVIVLMTRAFTSRFHENIGAFYLLLLSALLGMFVLASVTDLLLDRKSTRLNSSH